MVDVQQIKEAQSALIDAMAAELMDYFSDPLVTGTTLSEYQARAIALCSMRRFYTAQGCTHEWEQLGPVGPASKHNICDWCGLVDPPLDR